MVADKGRLRGWRYPVQFLDGANPAQLRVVDRPLATLRQFARRRVPVTFAPGVGAMDDADEPPLTDYRRSGANATGSRAAPGGAASP